MTTIYLLRHAHAEEWPHDTANAPLTALGEKQAHALADRLKETHIHCFYTSSYKRSSATAKAVAKPHELNVLESKETLVEVDFRVQKNLSLASFVELQDFYTKSEADQIQHLLTAQRRTMKLLRHLFGKHKDQTIVVVSHGNIIRATILGVLDLQLSRFGKFMVSEASVTRIDGTSVDDATLVTLNDTAHLEGITP